jgi:hypothetical protein
LDLSTPPADSRAAALEYFGNGQSKVFVDNILLLW